MAGVLVLSFDALLIRLALADAWTVLFWRGLFIGLSLSLVLYAGSASFLPREIKRQGPAAVASGILFGLSSTGFVFSVVHTHVANTVLVFSTAPIFAALFTRFILRERMRRGTWPAIGAVIAGVAVVFQGSLAAGNLAGDLMALFAAVMVGANFTLLRRHPRIKRTPVVALGGFIAAGLAFFWASPLSLEMQSYLVLALMGLVQMPLASMLLAVSTRSLSSPEVSLILLLEAILGPLWVWLVLKETPPSATLVGGVIIILTLALYFLPFLHRDHHARPGHRA